ncbi:MAG: helicase-exonuclease AddAB subunit AddB [Clostridiales bacterium]|nr:helicase-exonuclease AddAB subunit AddB [Clostridiales bacterium]
MGLGGPEVLSFKRLARKVLDEVGGLAKQHINQAGRAMIIQSVLDKCRSELKAFGRPAGQKGFTDKLSTMLSEFKRYNINPQVLADKTNEIDDRYLKDKLDDLTLIYTKYEEMLHEKYIDMDDDLTLLKIRMDKSKYLKGAEIWIDEFSGFTPQEYEIISMLLQMADKVNVCLTTDCLADTEQIQDIDVFSSIKYSANELIKIARDSEVKVEKPVALKLDSSLRFRDNKELQHMEQFLFQYPYKVYSEKTGKISILSAANLHSEVENTANIITGLCRDKDIRYKDIAVIARNLDDYEKLVRIIFPQYNIPFFIDKKRAVTEHPLTLLVLSIIQIIIKNFSYESMFRYLKTGLLSIPRSDIDILENYVLANGIRGSRWYRGDKWDYRIEYSIEAKEPQQEELDMILRINGIRDEIIEPISQFWENVRTSKKARDLCRFLYEFLCNTGIPEKIKELGNRYKEQNESELADEYKQIWGMIIEVLDQIAEVNGEEIMKLEQFYSMLELGFAQYSMGLIPHAADQVLVGSIDRWRSHEIKALFIIGANDGILPAASRDEGMLTDKDRGILKSIGLELAPDTKAQAFDEQFLLYSSLTKTGDFLRISYPLADSEGKGLRPSPIINKFKRLFPNMSRSSDLTDSPGSSRSISAAIPTFNMLIKAFKTMISSENEEAEFWKDVYIWFLNKPEWKDKLKYVAQGLFYENTDKPLTSIQTNRNVEYISVSRLEKYKSCPFSYYVQYDLKAKERRIMKMEAPDIGSFLHLVISRFSEELKKENIKWADVTSDWSNKRIDFLIEDIVENASGIPLKQTKRYIYLKDRLKRIVKRSIWLIIEHAKRSGFEPIMYEAAFGEKDGLPGISLSLPNGEKVVLSGRIDRIDILEKNEENYVRIIDYKSGNKSFSLSDVYYGLQLQLTLYLSAIWEKGLKGKGKVTPAGIFYFKLDEPMIRVAGKDADKDIEKEIMKELKMKGLILADAEIVKEMDRSIDGNSVLVPARINKDGTLGKNSSVATIEQFENLKTYVRNILIKISTEMKKGDISISPYKKKNQTSCRFCPYSSICRFEVNLPGNRYRILKELNNEKAWEELSKNAGDKGGGVID